MLCSTCGSKLLDGSNVCLHCGRVEASVRPATTAAPVWVETPRRRVLPWIVGVLLAALLAGLALFVFWPRVEPVAPRKPAFPDAAGLVSSLERAPTEGWTIPLADLKPAGTDRLAFVVPAEVDAARRDVVVAVASGAEKTYLRAMAPESGGVRWSRVLPGRHVCAFDRADGLVCLSHTRQLVTVDLTTGQPGTPVPVTVESPGQVWVAPDGAVFVLSVAEVAGAPTRTLGVTVTRVAATGQTVWTQTANLVAAQGVGATLVGNDTVVAVQTIAVDGPTLVTPTMARRQERGDRLAAVPDGADATLMLDGRLAVGTAGRSTVFDGAGVELFPVVGRVTGVPIRDTPADRTPAFSVAHPAQAAGAQPQPPQLLRIEPNGANPAEARGFPRAVCGGALVYEDLVATPPTFGAKPLQSGGHAWHLPHEGEYVAGACDGKRFAALTRENGALVVRGYLVGVGDVAWKTNPLADRDYLGFLAGAGWVLRDTKQDRVTLLRG